MKKLSWLILLVFTAIPCALYAQTDPTPSSSDLALPAMPHPITPVPEIGRIWAPSPTPQTEGFGLGAPITEKGLEVPSPTPQGEVPVLSTTSPSPVSSAPEVSPTVAPAFAGVVLAMGKTTPYPKVELDTTLGGLEGFNGEKGLGWGGSIACYDPVSPDLGLGGSLGFYVMNSQVVSDNTYTTVPPSAPSTSPGQEVLAQTNTRFQILGSAKVTMSGSNLRPYLLAGLGVAFISDTGNVSEIVSGNTVAYHTLADNNQTCAVGEAGVGLKIPLVQALDLALEGKVDLLYDPKGGTTTTYLPFQAGLGFGL